MTTQITFPAATSGWDNVPPVTFEVVWWGKTPIAVGVSAEGAKAMDEHRIQMLPGLQVTRLRDDGGPLFGVVRFPLYGGAVAYLHFGAKACADALAVVAPELIGDDADAIVKLGFLQDDHGANDGNLVPFLIWRRQPEEGHPPYVTEGGQ